MLLPLKLWKDPSPYCHTLDPICFRFHPSGTIGKTNAIKVIEPLQNAPGLKYLVHLWFSVSKMLANLLTNVPRKLCLVFRPSRESFFVSNRSSLLAIWVLGRMSCDKSVGMSRVPFLPRFLFRSIGVSLPPRQSCSNFIQQSLHVYSLQLPHMEREPKIFAKKIAYLSSEVLEEMCDCMVLHPVFWK